jgi:trans-aconitate 2-methyltransferase
MVIQMPANDRETAKAALSDLAREEPWRALLSGIDESFREVPPPEKYQQILREIGCSEIDCYYHTFHHPMQSPAEVVEWYRATGLRPFINALAEDQRAAFLDSYRHRLESAYGTSGAVTFYFKRLFIWARRPAV